MFRSSSEELAEQVDGAGLRTLFCRMCLRKRGDLVSLNSKLTRGTPLIEVARVVSGLAIDPREDLPTGVCGPCVDKLEAAYDVHLEFKKYGTILRSMMEGNQLDNHYEYYEEQKYEEGVKCTEGYLAYLTEMFQRDQEEIIMAGEIVDDNPTEVKPVAPKTLHSDSESDDAEVYIYSWKELCPPKPKPKPTTFVQQITKHRPCVKLVPHTCYVCDTTHENRETLNEHLELHAPLVPYTCAECHCAEFPAVFRSTNAANQHLLMHHYAYKCDYCWHRQPSLESYRVHMRQKHECLQQDGFTCETCGVKIYSGRKFSQHVLTHRAIAEERFKCQHCALVLRDQQRLLEHERTHTGERPFQCRKCDKSFNKSYNLRVHMRRHTGEKPFTCDVCSKAFVEAATLRYHKAVHFPDDPRYRKRLSEIRAVKE